NIAGQASDINILVPNGNPMSRTLHGSQDLARRQIDMHDSPGQRVIGDVFDIVPMRDDPQLILRSNEHVLRTAQIRPLPEEFPVFIENLDPVILTVTDVHRIMRIYRNGVRNVKLTRTSPTLAPCQQILAVA